VTRILALDVGTSSVRAQVFGADAAEEGALAHRGYAGENDPDRLVDAVRAAINEAGGDDLDAVGCSCFGHSLIALDADGKPLTPVLGWRDTRSADAAAALARRVDPVAVHERTGCHIHTSYWPAKLAWLSEEQPDVFRGARRFVSFADYLYAQLPREDDVPATLALASGSGLVDLDTQTWDFELLEVLGVGEDRLPRIGDDAIGKWFPALPDGACSNIGVGCVTRERAALMIGTSGAFRTIYATGSPQPRPGLFLYRLDERRVVEGGALSDGGNLAAWISATLNAADGSLADRDPDSHGLTFLTLLGGERSVGWHQHAKGAVHGLTFATTPLDLRQAALEGVAFRFAEIADLMPEVEEIVATGRALAGDDDWLQIMADALARPITTSPVREGSLRGAAVTTLERLGETAADAPLGRVIEPRSDRAAAYAHARERQRETYDALFEVPTGRPVSSDGGTGRARTS
jgi:gluconokinase